MILISKPFKYKVGDRSRLAANITIDDTTQEVWFDVANCYEEFLCDERADAFIIGVLFVAMQSGHNIICEAPIGSQLYYQITTALIPAVCSGSPRMHHIQIKTEVDSSRLPNHGAVGTGISCGVDSLCTLASNEQIAYKSHKITHLTFFNVGSNGEDEEAQKLYPLRKQRAIDFCNEYGFELIDCDSNIMNVIRQSHYITSTYTCGFAIFCLQKLFSIYYLASSTTFKNYTLIDNDLTDSSKYDLLSCYCFSTNQLKIYTDGAELSRLDKVRRIASFEPAFRYLNVCTIQDKNCCRCEKCLRTISELEYLGALNRFSTVFDLDYLKNNRKEYLQKIYQLYFTKSDYTKYYKEVWPFFKKDITLGIKIRVWYRELYKKLQYYYWKYYISRNTHQP